MDQKPLQVFERRVFNAKAVRCRFKLGCIYWFTFYEAESDKNQIQQTWQAVNSFKICYIVGFHFLRLFGESTD